jgi:hypothetical protein
MFVGIASKNSEVWLYGDNATVEIFVALTKADMILKLLDHAKNHLTTDIKLLTKIDSNLNKGLVYSDIHPWSYHIKEIDMII